jgi:hypothetical protein
VSRYFLVVVLVVFGWVSNGAAQQKPDKPVRMPVIDSVVECAHGDFGSHGSVSAGATMTLNLNALDKISLDLQQGGPFRLSTTLGFLKLVSSGPDPRVTIYVRRFFTACAQPQPEGIYCELPTNDYEITIVTETEGHFPGFALLRGTATD